MTDLFSYLKYYGNSDFKEISFNDMDSLILTQLVYAKFLNMAPSKPKESIKLRFLCEKFLEKYSEKDFKKEDYLFPNSYRLVVALKDATRFSDALIYHYIEQRDNTTQFGALTVRFSNGICFVAFEGTDSSIAGWREDLELMYKYPTISQEKGLEYLKKTIKLLDQKIYIGGHSKGGNIAMYAYMKAPLRIKRRIINVYNFDGPGFLDDVIKSDEYISMQNKLRMFVPEQSVVGMILGHQNYTVIKSHGIGILQHDAYTWCCFGGKLQTGSLSKKSRELEEKLKAYLLQMKEQEKKDFVSLLSKICEDLNINNVMQFKNVNISTVINIIKEIKNMPSEMRRRYIEVLKLLILG